MNITAWGDAAVRHGAQTTALRNNAETLESKTCAAQRKVSNHAKAVRAAKAATDFIQVHIPQGLGGVDPDYDQAESLASFVNAEYRLDLAGAA